MEQITIVLGELGSQYIGYMYYQTTVKSAVVVVLLVSIFSLAAYIVKKANE